MTNSSPRAGSSTELALTALAVFVVALVVRLVALGDAGMFDEYYHVLAAQQWMTDGTFGSNVDGHYDRAAAFTLLVLLSMRAFGETLVAARIPALIAGSLLPLVIYLGIRRIDPARLPALLAAGFVIFDPYLLGLSQVARFYTLHALLFWIGVFALYAATKWESPLRRRILWSMLAVAAFTGALHLQIVTVIGFGAVVIGLVLADMRWILGVARRGGRSKLVLAGLALLVLLVVAGIWIERDTVMEMWRRFGWTPPWLEGQGGNVRYYHWFLQREYQAWWPLLPFACVVAVLRRRRLAIMSAVAFAVVFVTSSLAASQVPRYIAYALPFMFIVWGLALADLIPWIGRLCRRAARRLVGGRWATAPLAIGIAGFLVVTTPAWMKTLRAVNPIAPTPPYVASDWALAAELLAPVLAGETIHASTAGPPALYHTGRLDFEIGTNFLPGGSAGREFDIDRRLGRPVLTSPESFELLYACYESGLVTAQTPHWREAWAIDDAAADWIVANAEAVPIPEDARIRAYRWTGGGSRSGDAACPPRHPKR